MTGFIRDITGATDQKAAAREGAAIQGAATNEAIAYQKEATAPYRALGEQNIPELQALLSGQGQLDYLQNNPLFNAAIENANQSIGAGAAARGKLGSGGTVNALFQNYLATGENYLNNQFNRLLSPVNIGASASTGNAANVGNLLTNNANAQAAAALQAGSAQANSFNTLLQGAATAAAAGGGGGYSDIRLKTDISPIGTGIDGLPMYEYTFIPNGKRYRGYMAHEVEQVNPDAVKEIDGYKAVSATYAPKRLN